MQLNQGNRNFTTIGSDEPIAYNVSGSAEFMSLLADGPYKDAPRAIIRELCNNASDSHAEAGQERPVEITLPTYSSPVLKIRDFGTGMSDEKMRKMYQTFGASDKNKTNEVNGRAITGCMGIGSKSPFAYSDIFTATSYHNGEKHVYCNAKNDKGEPKLIPQGTFETDEPNGFEVSIPVKEKDFLAFKKAVRVALRPFKYRPIVVNDDVGVNEHEFVLEGKGWGLRGEGNESLAVMAQVEYPIDHTFFGDEGYDPDDYYGGKNAKNNYQILLDQGLVLDFGPGEVLFGYGREALQYRPYTVKAIRQRLSAILEELTDIINDKLKACKNLWAARLLYQEMKYGEYKFLYSVLGSLPAKWNGISIHETTVLVDKIKGIDGLEIWEFRKAGRWSRRIHPLRKDNVQEINLERDRTMHFVTYDTKKGGFSACMRAIRDENMTDKIYLVRGTDSELSNFQAAIGYGDEHTFNVSDVPAPPKRTYERNKVAARTLDLNAGSHAPYGVQRRADWWDQSELDTDEGGVYVVINNYEVVGTGHPARVVRNVRDLKTAGINVPTVYGITVAKAKKLAEDDNWTLFHEWATIQIDAAVKDRDLQGAINHVHTASNYRSLDEMVKFAKGLNLGKDSPASDFFDAVLEVNENRQKFSDTVITLQTAAYQFNHRFDPEVLTDLTGMEEGVNEKYPMFSLLGKGYPSSRTFDAVSEYIKLVDSQESAKC